jgi:Oxidoreductase family, NAD-binding Rossmann fold
LASDLLDAVYVALPVSMHTEWTLRALEAGKHVLCEKPFATNPTDAARCFDAAEAAGAVVVEGFMWRHHPQTGGRPTVPDPWLCRAGAVELETGGHSRRLPADPDGAFGLTGEEADAYRIEFDVVSAAIAAGDPTEFGRVDAVDQAAVLEAVGRSAASGLPVQPPPSAAGPVSPAGRRPEPPAAPSTAD